jgi:hypothetical protein
VTSRQYSSRKAGSIASVEMNVSGQLMVTSYLASRGVQR